MMARRIALIALLNLAIAISTWGRDITFTAVPADLQLYPRDTQDSCEVDISGFVETPGYDSIKVVIHKNEQYWKSLVQPLEYVQDTASFSFTPKIHAELSDYKFGIYLDDSLQKRIDHVVCGDAFLIEGQSNAVASAEYPFRDRWVRTFGTTSTDPVECLEDTSWAVAQETVAPTGHAEVGIWGLRMGHLIAENYGIPVCIINGAQGGTHITQHLRDANNPYNPETIYGRHLYRTTKADLRENIKAVLWHQGEADTWLIFAHTYQQNFDEIYNDWLRDYPAIEKVYIWQLRQSFYCGNAQPQIREIQRQTALNNDNINIMATANLEGHDGLHYNADGYEQMGDWIYPLVARDYYGLTDTLYITPPAIQEIYYTCASRDTIAMLFDQPVIWPEEPFWGEYLEDYIYLDGVQGYVQSGYTNPQNDAEIILVLTESTDASKLSYTADDYYRAGWEIYEGPWIVNRRDIGAVIFWEFPIDSFQDRFERSKAETDIILEESNSRCVISATPNPFNPTTTFSIQLLSSGQVNLSIFDIGGCKVATLIDGFRNGGIHQVTFDATELPSGVYLYQLETELTIDSGKLVLLK